MTEDAVSNDTERPDGSPLRQMDAQIRANIAKHVTETSFAPFEAAITSNWLSCMQAEAQDALANSVLAEQTEGLSYRAKISGLGPVARSFLLEPAVISLLSEYFGGRYALSEDISCLTFYDADGHLGVHLDEPAEKCSVTIIIYLAATSPDPNAVDTGLVLNVYGESEASIGQPSLRIATRPGTIVLGRGSRVWHERPPLKPGECVTAITGCFRLVG